MTPQDTADDVEVDGLHLKRTENGASYRCRYGEDDATILMEPAGHDGPERVLAPQDLILDLSRGKFYAPEDSGAAVRDALEDLQP